MPLRVLFQPIPVYDPAMNSDTSTLHALWLLSAIACGAFTICLAAFLISLSLLRRERRDRQRSLNDSLDRSRAVMRGQVAETFAPLLPGFPFNHKDARFLGQPVDFLVFNGLSDGDGQQGVEIVLVEIKTGGAVLSQRELAIREAVRAGRVRWLTLRLDDRGQLVEI